MAECIYAPMYLWHPKGNYFRRILFEIDQNIVSCHKRAISMGFSGVITVTNGGSFYHFNCGYDESVLMVRAVLSDF
jgi:hypothetical protein